MMLAGLKKCMPMTSWGPPARRGDGIDVQGRGVGGENGILAANSPQRCENLLLHGEALEDRFDHEIHVCKRLERILSLHATDGRLRGREVHADPSAPPPGGVVRTRSRPALNAWAWVSTRVTS
jgi:hypothetical protein